MRELPLAHPGTPDLRSPTRFLLWVARGQPGTLAIGALYGVIWMATLAVVPALVGRGIDVGVAVKLLGSCEEGGGNRDQLLTTLAANASQKGTYYYALTVSDGKVQRIQERLAINAC